jgi:hypothetical protein
LGLEIIPNPNSGQFLLRSSSTLHEIDILDLSGKPILELRNLNTKSLQLDLSTISPGTYFVLSPGMYPQKVMILK